MSEGALELGADLTSYPPEVGKLAEWDQHLSVIAREAADLQQELSRLREESEAVVRLLEQREGELEQKRRRFRSSRLTVTKHRASMSAANASLSEAQALLEKDRERIASLEQLARGA